MFIFFIVAIFEKIYDLSRKLNICNHFWKWGRAECTNPQLIKKNKVTMPDVKRDLIAHACLWGLYIEMIMYALKILIYIVIALLSEIRERSIFFF